MMPLRKIQLSALSILGVIALFHSVGSGVQAAPQDDLRYRINEIVRNEDYSELKKLGPPAMPYVLELLESSNNFDGHQLALFFFIMQTEGRTSDEALVRLLSHPSCYLRGLAAKFVGARKIREAVPELIPLLQDRSVFGKNLCGGEVSETPGSNPMPAKVKVTSARPDSELLVMDEAVKALESITGLEVSEGRNFDKRAIAWMHWWQKQQKSKSEWTQ
jgi:hypothetical protein